MCPPMHYSDSSRPSGQAAVALQNPVLGGLARPALDNPIAFYRAHLWWPLAAFAVFAFALMGLGLDQWLADRLYAWQGHGWNLRDGFFIETVAHGGGRRLSQWLWLATLVTFVLAQRRQRWAEWRLPLLYLLLCVVLSTAMVAWMKRWTQMDCPWDLLRYGGTKAYHGLFEQRASGGAGACFPAGHASAGYAWVAAYFFLGAVRPRWRWWGLAAGLAMGALFGLAQQLRGAHFLSHDVWSLMICWLVALALHRALRLPGPVLGEERA